MAERKVTVVGAGQVGATTAFLLAMKSLADVVLVDIADGLPQGKALDMMHARSVERFETTVTGANDYAHTAGSDVVVVTAGLPRKPGMTREDLLHANAEIVRAVIPEVVSESPGAIVVCVTNPLDVMTHIAWKVSGLETARIFGMGGVLDSARFAYFIAEATEAPIHEIDAVVVGAHGESMVPLPGHSTVRGMPLDDVLPQEEVDEIVQRTIYGGAEVVGLLKTGSAFYAPAASVAATVEAILNDTNETLSSCVYLDGAYGIDDIYTSVPAMIGAGGVTALPELDLTDAEHEALAESAAGIAKTLDDLGWR
jgi:malate dehydrogenase